MSDWRGRGVDWGHAVERACRRETWHSWVTMPVDLGGGERPLEVCEHCHVRRCQAAFDGPRGRCVLAIGHPAWVHHRFSDLWSEPVGGSIYHPDTAA